MYFATVWKRDVKKSIVFRMLRPDLAEAGIGKGHAASQSGKALSGFPARTESVTTAQLTQLLFDCAKKLTSLI